LRNSASSATKIDGLCSLPIMTRNCYVQVNGI